MLVCPGPQVRALLLKVSEVGAKLTLSGIAGAESHAKALVLGLARGQRGCQALALGLACGQGRGLELALGLGRASGCQALALGLACGQGRGLELALGLGRRQRRCQALAFGFVGLQLGGGTVPLCPNLAEATFQSGALGRSASQLEIGLNALTQIAEVGTDPCRRAGRGGRGEEFLQGRKLILADREYSQAVVMKEGEVRVRAAKLVPKAPDAEIPLPHVDVMKQARSRDRRAWGARVS